MTFEPNEIFRAIVVFAFLIVALLAIVARVGRRRTFMPDFSVDRELHKLHNVTPYRGAVAYLFRSLAFYMLALIFWAVTAAVLVNAWGLFTSWLLKGLVAVVLFPFPMAAMNKASEKIFPHSLLARKLTYAIQVDPKLPDMNFITVQTGPSTVRLRYASPHPSSIFRERRPFLQAAGNIDIFNVKEVSNGQLEFELSDARTMRVQAGEWVSKPDGSLILAKESSSYREVYFMYDPNFISDDGRRGRIKIGGGDSMQRHANGRTWVLNLQVLGYFQETPEFNEDALHNKFEHLRINRGEKQAGDEWFYDSPEIRDLIEKKRLEVIK